MGGTLIILISSLFMNAGAGMYISDGGIEKKPNKVVMNTVIAAAISGLLICLINQGSNL